MFSQWRKYAVKWRGVSSAYSYAAPTEYQRIYSGSHAKESMQQNPGEKQDAQDDEEIRFRKNEAPNEPGGDNCHDHIGNGHAKEAIRMDALAGLSQNVSVLAKRK